MLGFERKRLENTFTFDGFMMILAKALSRETSFDPDGWSEDNPFYGHCAVVVLLAHDVFGGDIVRIELGHTPLSRMRSHYFNRLDHGQEMDFTESQFSDEELDIIDDEDLRAHHTRTQDWEELLTDSNTRRRYFELKRRFKYFAHTAIRQI